MQTTCLKQRSKQPRAHKVSQAGFVRIMRYIPGQRQCPKTKTRRSTTPYENEVSFQGLRFRSATGEGHTGLFSCPEGFATQKRLILPFILCDFETRVLPNGESPLSSMFQVCLRSLYLAFYDIAFLKHSIKDKKILLIRCLTSLFS